MSTKPLWVPTSQRAASSNIVRFAEAAGLAGGDYPALHRWSVDDPGAFWSQVWDFCGVVACQRGPVALQEAGHMADAVFFPQARLNLAENLLHPSRGADDAAAILEHCEDGSRRQMSRGELRHLVRRLAAAMRTEGVRPGDRVASLLPNVAESYAVMLAAASVGAVFCSTSPDFGAAGTLDRFAQIQPSLLFAVDAYRYGGRRFDCAPKLAEIRAGLPGLTRTVLLHREGDASASPGDGMTDLAQWIAPHAAAPPDYEQLPFDHPLYILFTSGTTGRPKCIVHRAGGILLKHLCEHQLHCDVRPGDRAFYFTTTGWMMWNWLATALASGAALVAYDGHPAHPGPEALFDLAEEAEVTLFGVSAKYIATLRSAGLSPRRTHSLRSMRTICSTGSPLAPEGFRYVYEHVKADVHLASISGGTDLCGCLVAGDPAGPVWAGEIQRPALGMDIGICDPDGDFLPPGRSGELVCSGPFPSQPLGFWDDPDGNRFRAAYFRRFEGRWQQGDWAQATDHGGYVITGRSDATVNPGGVRIGTAEITRVVDALDEVAESLVVGQPWQGDTRLVLFVCLRDGTQLDETLRQHIRSAVRAEASPRHVPAVICEVPDLPRTRSGKTVELAVREVVCGREPQNLESLANPESLQFFRDRAELR